jgi:colanic acid biosynthesis glycosyl transferase WcaI
VKILIVGLNYAPEIVGVGVYTSGLARNLGDDGNEVSVICSQPYYPQWRVYGGFPVIRFTSSQENGVHVLRCPTYVPREVTGPKRLLHYLSFAAAAFPPAVMMAFKGRPEIVLAVGPSIIAAPVARLAAWICGAKSWLHIQDFEVEAAMATGLFAKNNLVLRIALAFERAVVRSFHRVSSISPQMCKKLINKGVRPENLVEFRNWVDTNEIRPITSPSGYRDEWGIRTRHVALYSGNIGRKQGIEIILEAARRLRQRRDLTFVICGDGVNRARLEKMAAGVPNVLFKSLQPRERLNDLLGLATVHLLPQVADAADLVLPSKLIGMLSSGRPVVATAAVGTGLAAEVADCGLITEPGNAEAFAAAIQSLIDDDVLRAKSGANARARAEEYWSEEIILRRVRTDLEELARRRAPC